MQRKATKQSPSANTTEKSYIKWIKERGICAACSADRGVIAHHCVGSSFKVHVGLERVQIGHAFVLGLCDLCDGIVTGGSHRAFKQAFGNYTDLWLKQYDESPIIFDPIIVEGIVHSGR